MLINSPLALWRGVGGEAANCIFSTLNSQFVSLKTQMLCRCSI